MKIVLISGKAEAGKTTAANIIKDSLGDKASVAIVPYGAYVKHTAKLLFNWDGKKDEAGRHLLQWWGTDIVRKQLPDFWVDTVVRLANVAQDQLDYLIIDDCRFLNEITAWRSWYPTIIRVERPGWENALTPEQRQHPSETALDDWKGFDVTLSATNIEELTNEVYTKVIPMLIIDEQEDN